MNSNSPPVIAILGSWSSGSTAITGYIARLGAYSCPPHQMTNDERTPNSHEPKVLRDSLTKCVDELTLKMHLQDRNVFIEWFRKWVTEEQRKAQELGHTHIVLKHPLIAYFIREINEVCSPSWVVITRDLERVEATRQRRGWHPVYGKAGATKIYNRIFSELMDYGNTALCVSFARFLESPKERAELTRFLSMQPNQEVLAEAENWLAQ